MPKELERKVAIVTGAGSGIGHAIAQRFGEEGAAVCVNYFGHEDQAEDLAAEISRVSRRSIAVKADVSRSDQVHEMVSRVTRELGPVDVLVNNAGVESPAPFLEITEESWNSTLNVYLKGAFLCAQACGRAMKDRGGSIVNISSIHEDRTFPGYTPYCVAKGGMRMMMRNAALELAAYRIRVNNVGRPGRSPRQSTRQRCTTPRRWPSSAASSLSAPWASRRAWPKSCCFSRPIDPVM